MKTIYLAGAINGCSDIVCKNWREYVKTKLGDRYKYLDPMRRDYRGKEAENAYKIVANDEEDINNSDIFLGYANNPSWGTAMEIFYAYTGEDKPWCRQPIEIILICDKENPSPWLIRHSHRIYKTLDESIEYLNEK